MIIKKNNSVEFLVGKNLDSKSKCLEVYNKKTLHFISDLGKLLKNKKDSKQYPDVITFAFFCRKNNLDNFKKKYLSDSRVLRLGLGTIFHITPSNIPTNFAYSLLFGLITGNSNIVKVPSKKFDQITMISNAINELLFKKKYFFLREMITIVRYSDNDEITKKLSLKCDARVIWGGDSTINSLRKFPIPERSIDIPFADRYSACFLNSDKIIKLKDNSLQLLIQKFYNDTFVVDQNACSSPQIIFWTKTNSSKAKKIFWKNLSKYISKKYKPPEISVIDNYNKLCSNLLERSSLIKNFKIFDKSIYTISLKKLDNKITSLRGKWGFFYEFEIKNLDKISKIIDKKFQTLTYYGFEKNYFLNFMKKKKLSGIDRFVPVGQALNIELVWDGYDLNKILSREVTIK